MTRLEPDNIRLRQKMGRPGEGVVIMVMAFGVDFGFGPVEDPERVIGAEVGDGQGNGTRPGLP